MEVKPGPGRSMCSSELCSGNKSHASRVFIKLGRDREPGPLGRPVSSKSGLLNHMSLFSTVAPASVKFFRYQAQCSALGTQRWVCIGPARRENQGRGEETGQGSALNWRPDGNAHGTAMSLRRSDPLGRSSTLLEFAQPKPWVLSTSDPGRPSLICAELPGRIPVTVVGGSEGEDWQWRQSRRHCQPSRQFAEALSASGGHSR